jgi:ABC-type nitrate/sulfonate/bicarbonate transport system substrate-binding protein
MAKPLSMTFLILLALFYPSWIHPQSKTPELVRIGYSGIGIAHDLLKIMGNNRIFEKQGLNAQSIYIGSGSLMNQAVVGGSIQFTTSDLPSQIQAALAGIDFKVISVTINRLDGAVMTRKGILNPNDLKGEKISDQPLWISVGHCHPDGAPPLGPRTDQGCPVDTSGQYAESHRGNF